MLAFVVKEGGSEMAQAEGDEEEIKQELMGRELPNPFAAPCSADSPNAAGLHAASNPFAAPVPTPAPAVPSSLAVEVKAEACRGSDPDRSRAMCGAAWPTCRS